VTGIPLPLIALIALTVVAVLGLLWSLLGSSQGSVKARLASITTEARPTAQVSVIQDDAPKSVWERLFISLGTNRAKQQSAATRETLRTTMRHAGFRRPSAVPIALGVRFLLMFGLPALLAPLAYAYSGGKIGLVILMLVGPLALGYILPTFVVASMATNRKRRIDSGLPDVLDLLVLCMEAGLGLNAAITRVAEERSDPKDPIGQELSQLASELRAGVPRKDALTNFAERTGSEDLRTVVAQLVHTERLGGNVGPALRLQSESVRTTHKLRAEEIANRMPIKMLLPTVLFMPALFIAIIAPVVIRVLAVMETTKGP
jgi:tight adherence protein C